MLVRKYVEALFLSLNKDEILEIYKALQKLSLIVKNSKFILIVKSPLLNIDEKIEVLKNISECENSKFLNFLRILLENKRIDLLKDIYKSFDALVSKSLNHYNGKVEGEISGATLKAIEEKLSKKFNAVIKLSLEKKDINGIKIFVDVLNVEISIDENRIKNDIISNILKAI
jgi:F-type H+-transporting ATPase subunit delta